MTQAHVDADPPNPGEIPFEASLGAGAEPDRLRAMVVAHADLLWRTLRRLGLPRDVAEDGVQRVFLVAGRRLADIEEGAERAFLVQTALRVAASEKRTFARRREEFDPSGLVEVVDATPGVDERIDQRRARELLDAVLLDLPLDLRAVFVLFELEELTLPTIASLLEVPLGTATSRLRRARETFHAAVRRHQARDAQKRRMR